MDETFPSTPSTPPAESLEDRYRSYYDRSSKIKNASPRGFEDWLKDEGESANWQIEQSRRRFEGAAAEGTSPATEGAEVIPLIPPGAAAETGDAPVTAAVIEAPEPAPEPEPEPEPDEEAEPDTEDEEVLSADNRNFLGNLPERTRGRLRRLYDKLYETPGVRRVIGKIEIAYNQNNVDRHQRKAVQLESKLDGMNMQLEALEDSKTQIQFAIDSLEQSGGPKGAADQLRLRIQDIDRKQAGVLTERDKVQSQLEAATNTIGEFTNRRDAVVDKLIGSYERQLGPMEKELERLKQARDHLELIETVAQARHQESLARLQEIEERRTNVEEALRNAGMSDSEIRSYAATAELDQIIQEGRQRIARELEDIRLHKEDLDGQIAFMDRTANPYRDKQEEFRRVKESRPIDIATPTRERSSGFDGEEQITVHVRGPASEKTTESGGAAPAEAVKVDTRPDLASYVDNWNQYVASKPDGETVKIDLKDFLGASGLVDASKLDPANVQKIMTVYAKYKKLPMDQFDKLSAEFFKKRK